MRATALDGFIRETIQKNRDATMDPSAVFARRIVNLLKNDYRAVLRRLFTRCEVLELISAGRIAWPLLNRKPLADNSLKSYEKRADECGITLVYGSQADAQTLLGFYLPKTLGFRRPLIWLNSAVKHRAIVGATFVHETGHHIVGEVFGERAQCDHDIGPGDTGRLENRSEVGADLFVSIAGIPRAMAVAMFRERGPSIANLRRGHRRMCERYGIAVKTRSGVDDLTCLFGSLHYLKLREALLTEFGL